MVAPVLAVHDKIAHLHQGALLRSSKLHTVEGHCVSEDLCYGAGEVPAGCPNLTSCRPALRGWVRHFFGARACPNYFSLEHKEYCLYASAAYAVLNGALERCWMRASAAFRSCCELAGRERMAQIGCGQQGIWRGTLTWDLTWNLQRCT